ncbi:MAG: carbon monoxide dehydrogenase, partial [Betaproteobacteria bacterium]|nr:carbon monoxide dehydrogenase [Betaproteobacteria bacterium]
MEMKGEQLIPLPQAATWEALNDPAVLKGCIPGCEAIERIADNEYEVVLTAKVGPVNAKFKGKMTVTDAD